MGGLFLASFLLIAFTPGLPLIVSWLGGEARLERADAIVVLGTGEVDSGLDVSVGALRRTLYGAILYQRGLAPLLVLSGHPGEVQERAAIAKRMGIPGSVVLVEERARTTREEALLLRDRLRPAAARRVLLVTELIETARARGALERVGFDVFPAPLALGPIVAPDGRLWLAREVLSEGVAWAYYRVAGYL